MNSNGNNGSSSNGISDYVNPFADMFDTQPEPQPTAVVPPNANTKIMITPDPNQKGHHAVGSSNMSHSMGGHSPTQSNPTELPQWFGHSLNTIHNHPEQPSMIMDNPFDFFDDDKKTNGSNAQSGLKLMNVSTGDILFEGDSDHAASPLSGVSMRSNLSPAKARKLKRSNHQQTKSMGLIAPPRAKGDKRPTKKKKKKRGGAHKPALSASFNNVFAITPDELGLDGLKNAPMTQSAQFGIKEPNGTAKENLLFTKSHSEHTPDSTRKSPPTSAPPKPGAKRPKIDAIVEMKRGAAMLKYGRRGFPQ